MHHVARRLLHTLVKPSFHYQLEPPLQDVPESVLRASNTLFGDLNVSAELHSPYQVAAYARHPTHGLSFETPTSNAFVYPSLGTDLSQGLSKQHRTTSHISTLDDTLQACLQTPIGRQSFLGADVIARQSVYRTLLHGHGEFYASYIDGKLFLEGKESPRHPNWNSYVSSHGFLNACTLPPAKESNVVIVQYLGGLKLLISGEVPCSTFDGRPGSTKQYLDIRSAPFGKPLERKYKDWYLRLRLMGIRKLFLGLRDEAHILQTTHFIATEQLLALAGNWDVQRVWDFGFRTLCAIRDYCQAVVDRAEIRRPNMTAHKRDDRVWLVKIQSKVSPDARIVMRELERDERMALNSGHNRVGIISTSLFKQF